MRVMYVRGILMLLLNDNFEKYEWLGQATDLCKVFNAIFETESGQAVPTDHICMQFLQSLSKNFLAQLLTRFHSLITIQVVAEDIQMDAIKQFVKVMDLLYRVNQVRAPEDRFQPEHFHNDAINFNVDLKPQISQWVRQTKV